MNTQFRTYKELLAEKARLNDLLQVQYELIKEDIRGIKEEIRPVTDLTSTLSMFFTRKAGSMLSNLGINLLVNGFVKKVLLSKTGWVTRFIIPLLLKNYASHLVAEPGKVFDKIMHLFSKNGKPGYAGIEAV